MTKKEEGEMMRLGKTEHACAGEKRDRGKAPQNKKKKKNTNPPQKKERKGREGQ